MPRTLTSDRPTFNIFDGHCPEQLSSIRDFEGAPGEVETDALSADAMLQHRAEESFGSDIRSHEMAACPLKPKLEVS